MDKSNTHKQEAAEARSGRSRERTMALEIHENGVHKNWDNNKARVIQEFLSTKREYAKKRGGTKLVAPRCVACSTEGKKEFPFSLQKEMRGFASKIYEKAKRSNPCKLGRNPKKKRSYLIGNFSKMYISSILHTIR